MFVITACLVCRRPIVMQSSPPYSAMLRILWVIFLVPLVLFRHHASGIEVWEGDTAVLPCGNGGTHVDIKWCKERAGDCDMVLVRMEDGTVMGFDPWTLRDVQLLDNSSLQIRAVSFRRDNGTFRCAETVNLNVLRPVKNVVIHGPASPVPSGTPVRFTCQVEGGHPAPNITWYLGDSKTPVKRELVKSDGVSEYNETETRVSEYTVTVTREMEGEKVVCEAAVRDRTSSSAGIVEVKYKPTVMTEIIPSEYKLGDEVALVCTADGKPTPRVSWSFDRINPGRRELDVVNDAFGTIELRRNLADAPAGLDGTFVSKVYKIKSLEEADVGTYVCLVRNSEGEVSGSVQIDVQTPAPYERPSMGIYMYAVYGTVVMGVIIGISIVVVVLCKRNRTVVQENVQQAQTAQASQAVEMIQMLGRIQIESQRQHARQTIEMMQMLVSHRPEPTTSVRAIELGGEQGNRDSYLHPSSASVAHGPYESLGHLTGDDVNPYRALSLQERNNDVTWRDGQKLISRRYFISDIEIVDRSSEDYPKPWDDTSSSVGDRDSHPYQTPFGMVPKRRISTALSSAAASRRQLAVDTQLALSPSHIILTPGQPLAALTSIAEHKAKQHRLKDTHTDDVIADEPSLTRTSDVMSLRHSSPGRVICNMYSRYADFEH